MRKTILQIFIGIVLFSCSPTKTANNENREIQEKQVPQFHFADRIDSEKLNLIKRYYNWNDEKVLIINYSQPVSSCHFDNNKITTEGKRWWQKFYSKVNTENSLNIYVLANGERVKLDNLKYFDDKDDFLLNNFFQKETSCFGILVLNNQGDYIQYNGHYSENQVQQFINIVKKQMTVTSL